MTWEFHPLVKRVLDGELTLGDLPLELRPEAEEALRMLAALDRTPVTLSPGLDVRVMETVRRRAGSPATARESFRAVRVWRWISAPRDVEIRLRVRPWAVGALAAAAALVLLLLARPNATPRGAPPAPTAASAEGSVLVRFVLFAPRAHRVAIAGTFNQWDREATLLAPAGTTGVWTTTLALAPGQHQYAFVVDGERWVTDPAAPAVDDGFGRRNSVVAVPGARAL